MKKFVLLALMAVAMFGKVQQAPQAPKAENPIPLCGACDPKQWW